MKYAEAKTGRVFVLRLEHGDVIHKTIEDFAETHDIQAATLTAVGAVDVGSRLLVGPEDGDAASIDFIVNQTGAVKEATGTGTLFPDKTGKPVLHMHLACGRSEMAQVGDVRPGVRVWRIMEVIIRELAGVSGLRRNKMMGLSLLEVNA